jgi:hypothetical protein
LVNCCSPTGKAAPVASGNASPSAFGGNAAKARISFGDIDSNTLLATKGDKALMASATNLAPPTSSV